MDRITVNSCGGNIIVKNDVDETNVHHFIPELVRVLTRRTQRNFHFIVQGGYNDIFREFQMGTLAVRVDSITVPV